MKKDDFFVDDDGCSDFSLPLSDMNDSYELNTDIDSDWDESDSFDYDSGHHKAKGKKISKHNAAYVSQWLSKYAQGIKLLKQYQAVHRQHLKHVELEYKKKRFKSPIVKEWYNVFKHNADRITKTIEHFIILDVQIQKWAKSKGSDGSKWWMRPDHGLTKSDCKSWKDSFLKYQDAFLMCMKILHKLVLVLEHKAEYKDVDLRVFAGSIQVKTKKEHDQAKDILENFLHVGLFLSS